MVTIVYRIITEERGMKNENENMNENLSLFDHFDIDF